MYADAARVCGVYGHAGSDGSTGDDHVRHGGAILQGFVTQGRCKNGKQ
jgi:hypothetical protein